MQIVISNLFIQVKSKNIKIIFDNIILKYYNKTEIYNLNLKFRNKILFITFNLT